MTNSALYKRVKESYQNALVNGVNLDLMTPEAVTIDMATCDADLEKTPYNALLEAVKAVQISRLLQG